ncbi:hypothetical protein EV2_037829 [Malus domestica]
MAMTVGALAHPNHISKPMDIMWHANCYKQFSSGIFFSSTKRTTFRAMRKKRAAFAEIVRNKFSAAVDVEKTAAAMMLELTALVTVRKSQKKIINVMDMMFHWFDKHTLDRHNQEGVVLQLVSTETESNRMSPKWSDEARLVWTKNLKMGSDQKSVYEVKFMVDPKFGKPGAITVSNGYENEFYLESVNIEGVVDFPCNSWVQPQRVMSVQRIFFCSKAYLPGETPEGLKELREMELRQLRGDGKGLRTPSDRIYDYDTYNDIGNPDKGMEFVRPTLGGNKNPHPRRCRTGRPPTKTDENMESPVNESTTIYVPRDEEFEEAKQEALDVGKLKGILRHIIPTVTAIVRDSKFFKGYSDINGLYSDASLLENKKQKMKLPLPKIFNKVQENLKFDPPKLISRDTSCCLRDDEFGRQAVAGINPLSIERLTVFPPVSKLDPSIYGSQESALEEEHLIGHLEGMSVQQALEENKLFILDYHDMFLPFLNQINTLDDRKAYGTRTILFLTSLGTLKPIAIELSLPPTKLGSASNKQVLTPPVDATAYWLWQIGKAHVCSNDAGAHQLIHHWLRVHACMEPLIIAAHRHLSVMHPIYKLLKPHMRYTLKVNALARQVLINAGGIIESNFTPGKYSMEFSCAAYRDWWRFDHEGLPADLIRRGVAIPDPTQSHGLRLLIEDYPYATDGLLIWSAIERLVQTYVNYYYPDASVVQSDTELHAWYHESINLGHADLSHASWWPKLSTPNDLIAILTTIIWITTAQHAALNFGQYPYGGYVPTRPPHMRRLVPNQHDDPDEYANFIREPQQYFLSSLPSFFEATKYMAVIDIISAHSPDEEYIGERKDLLSTWSADTEIVEAFYRFSMEMKKIEKEIEGRNGDSNLRNRCGAGVSPYELLMPSSEPGVTCRGVPNSITI